MKKMLALNKLNAITNVTWVASNIKQNRIN